MTDRHATIGYMVKNFFLFDKLWGVHNNCGDLSCGSGQWGMDYQWYKDCPFSWCPYNSTKALDFINLEASPYYYYADAFDGTYTQWTVIGASPYLGTIDYPVNFINLGGVYYHFKEGIFSFPASGAEHSQIFSKAELEVYGKAVYDLDLGPPSVIAFVWDGSSWTPYDVVLNEDWGWVTVDISDKINTWAKLDGCRVYLEYNGYVTTYGAQIDAMRLTATILVGSLNADFIECRANQSFPSQSIERASMGMFVLNQSGGSGKQSHLCCDVYLDHFTYPAGEWMKLALVLLLHEGNLDPAMVREHYYEADLKESPKVQSYMPYNKPAAGEAYSDTFTDLPLQQWTHIDLEIEKFIERFRTIPNPFWYVKAIWLTAECLMDNIVPPWSLPYQNNTPPVYVWV
jgi:hypothetical protein